MCMLAFSASKLMCYCGGVMGRGGGGKGVALVGAGGGVINVCLIIVHSQSMRY